jgi:hypothetical protein
MMTMTVSWKKLRIIRMNPANGHVWRIHPAEKAKTKKGESSMLKKLIEELNTSSNLESQPEIPGNFTDLYNAIIIAKERIGSTN